MFWTAIVAIASLPQHVVSPEKGAERSSLLLNGRSILQGIGAD